MTPDERAAYDHLTEAIANLIMVKGYNDGQVMTDWVVSVALRGFDSEGNGETGIVYLVRDGDLPWHNLLGLVEAVRLRLHQVFNGEEDGS